LAPGLRQFAHGLGQIASAIGIRYEHYHQPVAQMSELNKVPPETPGITQEPTNEMKGSP